MIEQVMAMAEHDPANGKYGNCMAACLAAILNIPIERIPNFDDLTLFSDNERAIAQAAFLKNQGFALVGIGFAPDRFQSFGDFLKFTENWSGDAPCIVSGATEHGINHAVIVQGGQVVMNPGSAALVQPTDTGAYHAEWVLQIQPHWSKNVTIRLYN